MADRILTWNISNASRVENTVGEVYRLDKDYVPKKLWLDTKTVSVLKSAVIDIKDDGISIFDDTKPILQKTASNEEWELFSNTLTLMEKDSLITLDIVQSGTDLMVSLELDED